MSDNSLRIVVYTDNPAALDGLAVQTEFVEPAVLADWAGPIKFNNRRKILAARHALQKFGGRVLLCDTDTYFRQDPITLLSRIQAGRTLMHLREGYLAFARAADVATLVDSHELRTIAGGRWDITPATPMFNSGVIGLDVADVALLDEAAYLTDQIYPHVPIHTIEQFSLGACFSQRTRLGLCHDAVYHYWPDRVEFCQDLERVLHDPTIASDEERWQRLLPVRPSRDQEIYNCWTEGWPARMRIELREVAKRRGMLAPLKRVRSLLNRRDFSS